MSTLCLIHGLNSSHNSFAYIARELQGEHTIAKPINYLSYGSLEASILSVSKQLPKSGPITLIGHSLGGVIAALITLAGTHDVQRVVTISSPLAGSKAAVYARWVVSSLRVLDDIVPTSKYIKLIAKQAMECPVLSIISTGGNLPTSSEPNDSVVTVASQRALSYAKKAEIKANHFEILLMDKTVELVRKFIKQDQNG